MFPPTSNRAIRLCRSARRARAWSAIRKKRKPNYFFSRLEWHDNFRFRKMKNIKLTSLTIAVCILLVACSGKNTESNVVAPGEEKSGESKLLNTGADLLQDKSPLKAFNAYLDGFHFYSGNINAQMEAHHYVSQLNEDIHQAIIFDGNENDAKIMGVEYIISEKLFKTLDEEEKKLWHSHHYEVKSVNMS